MVLFCRNFVMFQFVEVYCEIWSISVSFQQKRNPSRIVLVYSVECTYKSKTFKWYVRDAMFRGLFCFWLYELCFEIVPTYLIQKRINKMFRDMLNINNVPRWEPRKRFNDEHDLVKNEGVLFVNINNKSMMTLLNYRAIIRESRQECYVLKKP